MCFYVFLGFDFSFPYHHVELLESYGVIPSWEGTDLWWVRFAGIPGEAAQGPGAVPVPRPVDAVTPLLAGLLLGGLMGHAKRLFLLLPSLLAWMPPAMPWIFACVLGLLVWGFFSFSFLMSCSTGRSGWAKNRVGKRGARRAKGAGRLAQDPRVAAPTPVCWRGLLLGWRRGTITAPSVLLL